MKRLFVGLAAICLSCAMLAGCGEPNSLSATLFGKVTQIEGNRITLQTGAWENGHFEVDSTTPEVTVNVKNGLHLRCQDKSETLTLDEVEVGTIVCFTVSASMDSEELITDLEVLQRP